MYGNLPSSINELDRGCPWNEVPYDERCQFYHDCRNMVECHGELCESCKEREELLDKQAEEAEQ